MPNSILGIIPARGGSKAILNKNIVPVAGKPLLAYTVEAAVKSSSLTRTILSTDDEKIVAIARQLGTTVPFLRPLDLAQDDTPMLPVIRHALDALQQSESYKPDIIVLLQPTSPLRTAAHIDGAVALLLETGADSVVSVMQVPHQFTPSSLLCFENGKLFPYTEGSSPLRRQDKPKLFARNGPAVLAVRCETIIKKNSLYGDDVRGLPMTLIESLDIDTPLDLELVECVLESRKSHKT